MPQKLSENQIDKMVAILVVDSLLDDALENYLSDVDLDEIDELDELKIDEKFNQLKSKLVKDLIVVNANNNHPDCVNPTESELIKMIRLFTHNT